MKGSYAMTSRVMLTLMLVMPSLIVVIWKKIVKEYLDDIADILMVDKDLLDELLKKLNVNINTW